MEKTDGKDITIDTVIAEQHQRRNEIDISKYRFVFAPLFDPKTHQFTLVIMDVKKKRALYMDPNMVVKSMLINCDFNLLTTSDPDRKAASILKKTISTYLPELKRIKSFSVVHLTAQQNVMDSGLLVLSYIREHSTSKAPTYTVLLTREELLDMIFTCLDTSRITRMFERYQASNGRLVLGVSRDQEKRVLQFSEVNAEEFIERPLLPHLLLINNAATALESLLWNFLQQPTTCWWLPFNYFTTGGNAMPKIYCAFTKDIASIRHYVPHRTGSRPLLAYRAQPIEDFPLVEAFDGILQRYGFNKWNYITIVMYVGKKSGISAHRDRQQVDGFEQGQEQIASFVFGEHRALDILGYNQRISVLNPSGCLYIMDGIQKYSQHQKDEGEGVSVSVIFRQLSPYDGDCDEADKLNMPVHLPWTELSSVSTLWKPNPNLEDDVPMKTFWFSRLHFNYSQRHPCNRQAIASKNNIIQSVLLTNNINNHVATDASSIMFHAPNNYCRLTALQRTKSKGVHFRVYCKTIFFPGLPCNLYLFCGTYFIAASFRKQNKLYFKFQRE